MEKTLLKKYHKKGEFKINYIPKSFILGIIANDPRYTYICIGPIVFEWYSYK